MERSTFADISTLEAFFATAERVCIVVHTHPDGDALGSGVAALEYFRRCRGAEACLLLPDPGGVSLEFLLPRDGVLTASSDPAGAAARLSACDLLLCLDMNGFNRAGGLEDALLSCRARKVLVDHHLNPDRECFDLVFSETQVSSASELLYGLLSSLPGGSKLPLEVLTPLMAGMTTDTNNFANSVFPSTLRMASELLAAGVDRDGLLDALYHRYRENRFRAMGWFLDRMTVTPEGVAYVILDRETSLRFGLEEGETDGFVNLPLGIGQVRLSAFLREDDGYFRVSLRSKPGVSANRLAAESFHGGGHECAAGGRLYFPQDIATREGAADYVETVAARFMRNAAPSEND
ncbi:MAG: DHH family phosphoesterase [Bacteroidales bacterium]|nr:DHH family phosphoesterase [Bacteroidales bacterium]